MRRAKIRPSINLSVSRRSAAVPVVQDGGTTSSSKPNTGGPKIGPTSTNESTIQSHPIEGQVINIKQSQSPQQKPGNQQVRAENEQQKDIKYRPNRAGITGPPPDPPEPIRPPVPDPSAKQVPASPTKPSATAIPDSPTKSANVRRKRLTAVPNLGQPRTRPGQSLTGQKPLVKLSPRPTTAEKADGQDEVSMVQEGLKESPKEGPKAGPKPDPKQIPKQRKVAEPTPPPPVRRVINPSAVNTKSKPPQRDSTPALKETPSPAAAAASRTPCGRGTHEPAAAVTPVSTPAVSQPRKHPVARSNNLSTNAENIYQKKLRELKDRMDSETPARRRRHYTTRQAEPPERTKMTMSDLIYYNPKTTPMKNTSGSKEQNTMTKTVTSRSNSVSNSVQNSENEDDENEEDMDVFAPQVKIGPDGSIIVDSTSLTKDGSPVKTLNLDEAETIQEDVSYTTYSSFRKKSYSRVWKKKETARFYMALSAVGTDFTMINAMFPKRTRQQIKLKFKREERQNTQAVDKAIRERTHFDMSLFNHKFSSDSEPDKKKQLKKKKKADSKTAKTKAKAGRKTKKRKAIKYDDDDTEDDIDTEDDNDEAGVSVNTPPEGAPTTSAQDPAAAGRSEGSDDDINMATILSQPTRSGRQPKFKPSYSVVELPKKKRAKRAPSAVNGGGTPPPVCKQTRQVPQRGKFPPYQPGLVKPPRLSPPLPQVIHVERQPAPGNIYSSPREAGISPDSRTTTGAINTPMGRFIVSVPKRDGGRKQNGNSPAPEALQSAQGRSVHSHIFVISSPDGKRNVIHVPVETETGSPGPPRSALEPPATKQQYHNPMMTPGMMLVGTKGQGSPVQITQLTTPQQTARRNSSKVIVVPPPVGSNKVVIMSPHQSPRVPGILLVQQHQPIACHDDGAGTAAYSCQPDPNLADPDSAAKVSHMTSDTDTDWLLRDDAVGHEVDIPTTDLSSEESNTEEAFVPPMTKLSLGSGGIDQIIMNHGTQEHLTARAILEQMTYEEGCEGMVGANTEITINEEIITQITSDMAAD